MLPRRFAALFAIAVVVLSTVAALGTRIGPRVVYYRERAAYHAQAEAFHRSELEKIRRQTAESDDTLSVSIYEYQEWEHSTLAAAHDRQKQNYREAAYCFWKRPPPDLAIPYPWDQDRDRQVIETAIVGWLDQPEEGDERLDRDRRDWRVVIDRLTSIEPWEQIGSVELLVEHGFPRDLGAAIERRNAAPVSLEQFKFSEPRIVIGDVMKLLKDNSSADEPAYITITLPAYSREGDFAVLGLSLYGTTHGSQAIHGLEKVEGHWRLGWSYFFAGE